MFEVSSMPRFRGAIFDVDGVLVDSPHEKAWRESLRELMESGWGDIRDRSTWSPDAFTSRVYEEQMSGKPRMSGARAALEYFHVPDDEEEHRLLEYAERKQAMVVRLIEAGDFTAYPDALRFIIGVKDAGLRVAAARLSPVRNAHAAVRRPAHGRVPRVQGFRKGGNHLAEPARRALPEGDSISDLRGASRPTLRCHEVCEVAFRCGWSLLFSSSILAWI
jgi:phosphoglycolate phosphatase-like HAD superfamily hydrolase